MKSHQRRIGPGSRHGRIMSEGDIQAPVNAGMQPQAPYLGPLDASAFDGFRFPSAQSSAQANIDLQRNPSLVGDAGPSESVPREHNGGFAQGNNRHSWPFPDESDDRDRSISPDAMDTRPDSSMESDNYLRRVQYQATGVQAQVQAPYAQPEAEVQVSQDIEHMIERQHFGPVTRLCQVLGRSQSFGTPENVEQAMMVAEQVMDMAANHCTAQEHEINLLKFQIDRMERAFRAHTSGTTFLSRQHDPSASARGSLRHDVATASTHTDGISHTFGAGGSGTHHSAHAQTVRQGEGEDDEDDEDDEYDEYEDNDY
ncbi:hypothetical protein EVG20_g824 [Dentipellis fragilis]|uniref:Uncharacterized protein n=1 Tax=Dentipellis fragilis TaxID=205917 RepID=A0A4Y9ZE91_9AGAM|nr:hypothetical protein EVG20_g824 [Dentipellis fragilis]